LETKKHFTLQLTGRKHKNLVLIFFKVKITKTFRNVSHQLSDLKQLSCCFDTIFKSFQNIATVVKAKHPISDKTHKSF
jgi:hypothetical protein